MKLAYFSNRSAWWTSMFLGSFCFLLFTWNLAQRPLTSSHEARAAQNAQMILDEGYWLVPRLYDLHPEVQKPPLYYWLIALIGWLRGGVVDAWAVRLPAALGGLGVVWWTWFLGQRLGRPRSGLLAALMLATSLHFTATARVGRIDMALTWSVALAVGGFYLGMRERKNSWLFLGYSALGLGLLLKGPIGVVLPLVVILFLAWRWPAADRTGVSISILFWSLRWGIPWTSALALPWYLVANWQTGNQIWEIFLWYHNVERGFGSDQLASHPAWFYVTRLGIDLLPWNVLMPMALWRFWRKGEDLREGGRFGLAWFGVMFALLSLMRFKRADYLVPAYPGAALFLGCWLDDLLVQKPRRVGRWLGMGFAAVVIVNTLTWAVYVQVWNHGDTGPGRLGEEIRKRTDGMVIFFRVEDHALAYHVGRPLDTILEWENLDIWANQPMPIHVVTSPECADTWTAHLQTGQLEIVQRWSAGLRRPLVLLRNRPRNP